MNPEDMRELVTESQVEKAMVVLAVAGPLLSLALGCIWGKLRGETRLGLLNSFVPASVFGIAYGMWRFYDYRTRYDPKTGYVGLHRVDVLVENLLIFVGVGVALGLIYGWYLRWVRRKFSVFGEPPSAA